MSHRQPPPSPERPPERPYEGLLRPATHEDLAGAALLLEAAGLPLDELEKQFGEAYILALRDGRIEGMAGLEVYGRYGFLRSVAVAPDRGGSGIGRRLVEDRIGRARLLGLEAVYLLTVSAAEYFDRLGFQRIPRSEAPGGILESSQFTTTCPESAILMQYPVQTE